MLSWDCPFKKAIATCFARTWRHSRYTFLKHIKPDTGEWATAFRKSRREEVAIARQRVGHTRFTHGFLLHGGPGQSMCPTCNVPLTVLHILLECRLYTNERRVLKGHCISNNVPFDLPHLLGDNLVTTEAACNFLRQSQLLEEIWTILMELSVKTTVIYFSESYPPKSSHPYPKSPHSTSKSSHPYPPIPPLPKLTGLLR